MDAFQQSSMLSADFPFALFINESAMSFPPHWHEEIEIIYVKSGRCKVGLNEEQFDLKTGDILLIGSGDIHYFLPRFGDSKKILIQFGLSFFDDSTTVSNEVRFITPLLSKSHQMEAESDALIYKKLEKQLLSVIDEYQRKEQGYKLVLKARLYDMIAILLRNIPHQEYTLKEKNKHKEQLKKLGSVFEYVEKNYKEEIPLEKAADIANYSVYYFTRFFKQTTGMTFGQYLDHLRIRKAEWFLINEDGSIAEVAFKAGFNSVKTFYRVFKKIKECTPGEYKESLANKVI